MKTHNSIAIIPAAGLGTRFHELGRRYPKCLLPYQGRPLLEHIAQRINSIRIAEVYIGVRPEDMEHPLLTQVMGVIRQTCPDTGYILVPINEAPYKSGPATTLLRCLEAVPDLKPDTGVLMLLSDCLFPSLDLEQFLEKEAVAAMPVDPSTYSRWCLINGSGRTLYDKPKEAPKEQVFALSGVYHFRNGLGLRVSLKDAVSNATDEPQFSAAMSNYAVLQHRGYDIVLHKQDDVVDMGTLEEFLRVNNTCKPREFNTISVEGDVVVKSSFTDPNKILSEASWYLQAPSWARPYLPSIHKVDPAVPSYTMERIHGHNLRYLALYYDKSYETWAQIFERVRRYLSHCINSGRARGGHWWNYVIHKTSNRTKGILDSHQHAVLMDELACALKDYGVLEQSSLFHGDLHFANMFWSYDGQLKLIDPRGEFYGHWLYDIAKLTHSVYGLYDFIDEGLFFSGDDSAFYYNAGMEGIRQAFNDTIILKLDGKAQHAIRVLCASLFASLIPLHSNEEHKRLFLQECERILNANTNEFFNI